MELKQSEQEPREESPIDRDPLWSVFERKLVGSPNH